MAEKSTRVWVKPAPDRVYRIPATRQLLEAEGREVDTTDLDWARGLRDGDVVACEPPAPASHAAEAPPASPAPPSPPAKAAKASTPAPEGEG